MRRSLVAIDSRVLNDERISDAEYRLLSRISLNFETRLFNADSPTLTKLKVSKATFYRLVVNLVKCEYLQHIPGSSQYSIPVSILGLKSLKSETEILNNETGESQIRDSEEEKETEEKRTKREDKEKEEDIYIYNTSSGDLKEKEIREKENNNDKSENKENTKEKEKPKRKPFVKPTLEEVKAYCRERESTVLAGAFYDWYESNGWKVGKNPMKDWKAAIRTWEAKDRAAGKYYVPPENQDNTKRGGMSEECPF